MKRFEKQPLRQRRFSLKLRRAAAAVEFGLIAPLFIMITMGMIEIGRVVMVQQVLVNISREGARLAVKADTSTAEVTALASQQLIDQGITTATISTSPSDLLSAAEGTAVTVTVSVPAASISWIPNPMFTMNNTLLAETTMRRESD